MTTYIVENPDDETVWGQLDSCPGAIGWSFAELIIKFCKIAESYSVSCSLKSRYECRDLETIKKTMAEVYSKLPQKAKVEIKDYYYWFLEKDKIIDWELFAQERPDQVVLGGDELHNSLKAIEEYANQKRNEK